jgi:hypothetical protein
VGVLEVPYQVLAVEQTPVAGVQRGIFLQVAHGEIPLRVEAWVSVPSVPGHSSFYSPASRVCAYFSITTYGLICTSLVAIKGKMAGVNKHTTIMGEDSFEVDVVDYIAPSPLLGNA